MPTAVTDSLPTLSVVVLTWNLAPCDESFLRSLVVLRRDATVPGRPLAPR